MKQYLDLLKHVRDHGLKKQDRTGTGTLSVFGYQMRFNLQDGFPLVTTKRTWFKGLAKEMLWFIGGHTNIKPLVDDRISIWTDWPMVKYYQQQGIDPGSSDTLEYQTRKKDFETKIRNEPGFAEAWGVLGPVYGKQWRSWATIDQQSIDQLAHVIQQIQSRPDSRRHIVNAWNVAEIPQMALPPCHMFFQFYVGEGKLSLLLYVRSNDLFLGAPFNIAQYALLLHLMAKTCRLSVGDLVYTIGDAHIYLNHLDQIEEQLGRTPYPHPVLHIAQAREDISAYRYEDLILTDYQHHPAIKAPVAV